MFAVAILAALLKIVAITGAEPVVLQTAPAAPAKPIVAADALAPVEKDLPTGPLLDRPEPGDGSEGPTRVSLGANLGARPGFVDAPSIFRRPSPDGAPVEPVCADLGDFPKSSRVVFPLPEAYFGSYDDTWGAPRPQGGHEGSDLMSPAGTPEFAVTDGTIVEVAGANENGWNRLGGYTIMLRADYDVGPIREGDLFYYAHMNRKSTLPVGTKVRAGQRLGLVGDTGEGPEVTRGKFPSHLHLGWYDAGAASDRSEVESGAMDPYPLLLWLEENGGAVSGGAEASYCEAPQGPTPDSDSPGERPDIDTRDARPNPVVEDGERRRDRPSGRGDEPANEPSKTGKTVRSRPGGGAASGEAVSTPVEEDPDRTARPVDDRSGGGPGGGGGDDGGDNDQGPRTGGGEVQDPSSCLLPRPDRTMFPLRTIADPLREPADCEPVRKDDREDAGDEAPDTPGAGDPNRPEKNEPRKHPDGGESEDSREPPKKNRLQPSEEPARPGPEDRNPADDTTREERTEASPESPKPEAAPPD